MDKDLLIVILIIVLAVVVALGIKVGLLMLAKKGLKNMNDKNK